MTSDGFYMAGDELRKIRHGLQLTQTQFGAALGYKPSAAQAVISRLERDKMPVPIQTLRLAKMYEQHPVPFNWIPSRPLYRIQPRQ